VRVRGYEIARDGVGTCQCNEGSGGGSSGKESTMTAAVPWPIVTVEVELALMSDGGKLPVS
jgi:hypothetical protein